MINMRGHNKQTRFTCVWLFFVIQLSVWWSTVVSMSTELPCHFLDSINITNGIIQPNKSIIFGGTEFRDGQYAEIDYILNDRNEHETVRLYRRGCICNLKPCIRLCSSIGSYGCNDCNFNDSIKNHKIYILDENNRRKHVRLDQQFEIIDESPCSCDNTYSTDENFRITHEGAILFDDSETLTSHQYCIDFERTTKNFDLKLKICFEDQKPVDRERLIMPIGMFISVIFIIATLIVYGCIPILRNLNGKCLMNYLGVLAIGYTLTACTQLGVNYAETVICFLMGYVIFFSFISAFSWLNVINFDFWLNSKLMVMKTTHVNSEHMNSLLIWFTTSFKKLSEKKQLQWYKTYAYGLPFLLTTIICMIDNFGLIPYSMQTHIGLISCFLSPWLTELLYFYVPVGVIITMNAIFFILTALNFHRVHQAAKLISSNENSTIQITLSQKKEIFTLYLRLSITAGIMWIMELISFLISPKNPIFLVTDFCNTLHGVFIFLLFIVKRQMFRLIKERWNTMRHVR